MKLNLKDHMKTILGENSLERFLTIVSVTSLLMFVASLGIWILLDRPYNKYITGLLVSLLYMTATLGLRYNLIEKRKEAENLAKSNYSQLKLSYEEALDYFVSRAEKEIFESWLTLTILITLIFGLVIIYWPI